MEKINLRESASSAEKFFFYFPKKVGKDFAFQKIVPREHKH